MVKANGRRPKRWAVWLIAPLPLFLPLLFISRNMLFGNRDALFYSNVLALTSDALRAGHPYTRWFADANAGIGSTVMLFYAPLAYIATALLEWPLAILRLDLGTRLMLGIYASQVLSGVTAFRWLKEHFSIRTAFIGSLLYLLLPYKLIYIYEHINLAQLWALVFLPLWMVAAEKLAAGGKARAAAIFALAGAATYYCHPLTVIAFGAVPACYALWFGRKRWTTVLWLALACGLMAGLCLMLAVPQREYLGWIQEGRFLTGKYDWRGNLYHVDIMLCAYYAMIAALVCWAVLRGAIRESGRAGSAIFWGAVIAIPAFMNLPVSAFLWEHLPLLKYLQFPAARLHAPALVAVIFLICVWLEHYKEMLPISPRVYRPATLAALIALFGAGTLARIALTYRTFGDLTWPYIEAMRDAHIIVPGEYKTRWGCVDPYVALDRYRTDTVPAPVTAEAGASAALQEWHPPRRIVFTADVQAAEAGITVRQCYVPVWEAFDSGKPVPLSASAPDGLIRMNLTPGMHRVEMRLGEAPNVAYARMASAGALALCLLLLWVPQRRKRASDHATSQPADSVGLHAEPRR
jgi:hypothetical protein